jgi:hypothetical protein
VLLSLKEIQNYQAVTQDGIAGSIADFLIDDSDWVMRYIIAQFNERKFPLSVFALNTPDGAFKTIPIQLSMEKIAISPDVDINNPLARDIEQKLSDYYQWPYYWETMDIPQSLPGDLSALPLIEMELDRQQEERDLIPETGSSSPSSQSEKHLASFKQLDGYTIFAANSDRNAGKLVDMVTQDKEWNILYLVAETGGMLSSKKVLLSPSWVQNIETKASRIQIDLTEETIHNSPSFNTIPELTEDYQKRVKRYFDNRK